MQRSLANIVTRFIFRKNVISDAFTFYCTISVMTQDSSPSLRIGTNIDLNTESFAFLNSSRFKTTELCKARISAFVLPDRISNFVSCLPSLVKVTQAYLTFTCNDTPPTCRKYWTGFLERWSTSVLEVLMFIPVIALAAAQPFNACWRPDPEESSKTNSSAND